MLNEGRLGCGSKFAHLYFMIFIIFVRFLLVNILVAFVLESYIHLTKQNTNIITNEDYNLLLLKW